MFKLKGLNIYRGEECIGRFSSTKANVVELKASVANEPDLIRQLSKYYGIFALEVTYED